ERDERPEGADEVAPARRAGRAEPLEREDEADGGEQVEAGRPFRAEQDHFVSSPRGCRALRPENMSSMRSVTTKPPTRLTVASSTAKRATTSVTGSSA